MHNWIIQVFWLDRVVAGEDTAGAGAVWWEDEYFHPEWIEYKYMEGVY